MKKILFFIAATAALMFSACDTEGDENPAIEAGYNQVSATFIQGREDYRITYNGSDTRYVSKSAETYTLEVFRLADDMSMLKEEVPVNEPVELIGLSDGVYIYSPATVATLACNVVYFTGQQELHSLHYQSANYGQALKYGLNYLLKENTPGRISIVREGSEVFVTEEVAAEDNQRVDLMQVDESSFIDVSIAVGEAAPVDNARTKVRFFLDPALNLSGAARITLSDAAGTLLATFDFDAKALSDFVEIENEGSYKYAIYNMADPANPALIRQNITLNQKKDGVYKLQTIKAGRYTSSFLLGTEW